MLIIFTFKHNCYLNYTLIVAWDEARTKDSILNDEQELATIDPIRLYKEKTCKNGGIKYRKSREFNDFMYEINRIFLIFIF